MGRKISVLFACLGLTCVSFGCSDCGGDPPTEDDAGDVLTDALDTAPTDGDEGGDDADGGSLPDSCEFTGTSEGVCEHGVPGGEFPGTGDAGDAEDGGGTDFGDIGSTDAGFVCAPPSDWESDESTVDDQLDNDCDGVADEGGSCTFLDRNEGVCDGGGTISDADGSCEPPEKYESDETTCGDGKDNDCDGVTGEGCVCNYNNTSTGVCSGGTKNEMGDCEAPGNYEMPEQTCDGLDNDCDGDTDDADSDLSCSCNSGDTQSCYTGQPSGTAGTGICKRGKQTCQSDGTWGSCMNEVTPKQNEDCSNQKDDNCDGVTNEGCQCDYTGTSDGVCSNGSIDTSGNCSPPNDYESDETSCDKKDNDCDGVTDENCPCAYNNTNTGVCGTATIDPSSGNCSKPSDYESTESTCDSKDNDCDGDTDDADSDLSCSCNSGDSQSCYTGPSGTAGTGECKEGTQTCQSDGTWGSCMNEVTPSSETCDSKDNDCDGTTDEGCPCDYMGNSDGVCANQTIDSSGNCTKPNDYETPESTCNDGLDNDCDGDADCADSDCSAKQCTSLSGNECSSGSCIETACQDGKDNDKDGDIDCLDSDCTYCSGSGSHCDSNGICHEDNCENGNDDDSDGNTDCADADCDNQACSMTGCCEAGSGSSNDSCQALSCP